MCDVRGGRVVAEPQKRDGGEIVESIDELVDKLKNEVKVI